MLIPIPQGTNPPIASAKTDTLSKDAANFFEVKADDGKQAGNNTDYNGRRDCRYLHDKLKPTASASMEVATDSITIVVPCVASLILQSLLAEYNYLIIIFNPWD